MNQKKAPCQKYLHRGKTVPLMMHLSKIIHGKSNIVVLDSDVCVLRVLVVMTN